MTSRRDRLLNPREWDSEAACYGKDDDPEVAPLLEELGLSSATELFFPPRIKEKYHVYADAAKDHCFGKDRRHPCPVRRQCLAWAVMTDQEHGILGGLSHRERNALVRKAESKGLDPIDHILGLEH